MPYQIILEHHFDSAHHLRGYKGKCAKPHGHRFLIKLFIDSIRLDPLGMIIDFGVVKDILEKEVLDIYDHNDLNEIPPFDKINPTAENIAKVAFEKLKDKIKGLKRVEIWESPTACGAYE